MELDEVCMWEINYYRNIPIPIIKQDFFIILKNIIIVCTDQEFLLLLSTSQVGIFHLFRIKNKDAQRGNFCNSFFLQLLNFPFEDGVTLYRYFSEKNEPLVLG